MKYPEGAIKELSEIEFETKDYYFVWGSRMPGKEILNKVRVRKHSNLLNVCGEFVHIGEDVLTLANIGGPSPREKDHIDFLFDNYWLAWAYLQSLKKEKAA